MARQRGKRSDEEEEEKMEGKHKSEKPPPSFKNEPTNYWRKASVLAELEDSKSSRRAV